MLYRLYFLLYLVDLFWVVGVVYFVYFVFCLGLDVVMITYVEGVEQHFWMTFSSSVAIWFN